MKQSTINLLLIGLQNEYIQAQLKNNLILFVLIFLWFKRMIIKKETYLIGRESFRQELNEPSHLPCDDETLSSSSSSFSLLSPTDDELSGGDLPHLLNPIRLDRAAGTPWSCSRSVTLPIPNEEPTKTSIFFINFLSLGLFELDSV